MPKPGVAPPALVDVPPAPPAPPAPPVFAPPAPVAVVVVVAFVGSSEPQAAALARAARKNVVRIFEDFMSGLQCLPSSSTSTPHA
jgi:hypothetical protein